MIICDSKVVGDMSLREESYIHLYSKVVRASASMYFGLTLITIGPENPDLMYGKMGQHPARNTMYQFPVDVTHLLVGDPISYIGSEVSSGVCDLIESIRFVFRAVVPELPKFEGSTELVAIVKIAGLENTREVPLRLFRFEELKELMRLQEVFEFKQGSESHKIYEVTMVPVPMPSPA